MAYKTTWICDHCKKEVTFKSNWIIISLEQGGTKEDKEVCDVCGPIIRGYFEHI